jgi:hypothetical protein
LTFYLNAQSLTNLVQIAGDFFESLFASLHIHYHHHVEIVLNDGLRDVENVDVLACQILTNAGDNTDGVFSYNGDNSFIHSVLIDVSGFCSAWISSAEYPLAAMAQRYKIFYHRTLLF